MNATLTGLSTNVEGWMATRLDGVQNATRFAVFAESAGAGAWVAMYLRDTLPGMTLLSAPDAEKSGDQLNPHVLACSAWMAGRTERQTREAVSEAFGRFETTPGCGPLLVFEPECESVASLVA